MTSWFAMGRRGRSYSSSTGCFRLKMTSVSKLSTVPGGVGEVEMGAKFVEIDGGSVGVGLDMGE